MKLIKKSIKYIFDRSALQLSKGQAVTEYLLLMVIVLTVIGAFLQAFHTGTQIFLKGVYGDGGYLDCLLREGELPGEQNGKCPMPTFSFKTPDISVPPAPAIPPAPNIPPAPLIPPAPNIPPPPNIPPAPLIPPAPAIPPAPNIPLAPNIPPPPNIPPGEGASNAIAQNKAGRGIGGGLNKGLIPTKRTSNNTGIFGTGRLRTGAGTGAGAGGSGQNNTVALNKEESDSVSAANNDSGSFNRVRGRDIIDSRFVSLSQKAKKQRDNQTRIRRSPASEAGGGGTGLVKKAIPLENRQITTQTDDVEIGWDFAFLLKVLVIAGILIGIFLLLGGQFLQIKKGLEGGT